MREAVDEALGERRAALVDEAWAARAAADERLPGAVRERATRVLSAAERVKYAQEVPTRFALEEELADVRAALEALASAGAGATAARERRGRAA